MTTKRIEKKMTSKQIVMRMTKNVDGYLDWISHSTDEKLTSKPEESGDSNCSEAGFKLRPMLKKIVAMLMTRSISRSKLFEKYMELAQEKGGSAQKLLKKMLVKKSDNEYLLRIFVRKPRHRKQLFQMVNGYPNPLYPEHAMVAMNKALLKEEKIAMRKELKFLLDADDNISPESISSWILPVVHNSFLDMDGAEVDDYLLEVHPVKGLESYSCLLQFIRNDNTDETHDVTIDVQIAIEMDKLPDKHQLQHPYPRTTAYEKKGRVMLKEMQQSFQEGQESILLCSQLYTSAAKLEKMKKKRKQQAAPAMTRLRLQMIERSRTAIFGKRRIESKKVWTMDFSIIEASVQQQLSKSENSFRKIEMAFKVYNNLLKLPSQVVPLLNEATQTALSLWMFKNSNGSDSSEQLLTHVTALLHLVQGCLKGNFCPSFFLPAYNTMAPKATANNPMGMTMEEVVRNMSDFEESDEDDDGDACAETSTNQDSTTHAQETKTTETTTKVEQEPKTQTVAASSSKTTQPNTTTNEHDTKTDEDKAKNNNQLVRERWRKIRVDLDQKQAEKAEV